MKLTARISEFLKNNPLSWEDSYDIDLSNIITEARAVSGMTQEALAKSARTTQSSIARAESGAVLPSHILLKKIASAVGAVLVPPQLSFETTYRISFTPNCQPVSTDMNMHTWLTNNGWEMSIGARDTQRAVAG